MTKNGGYTIEVDPDKLDELASGIGTAEMKCSFALSKLKWGMGSIAADIAGVGGGNINHLQEKFEGSIKKYKDLLDDSQAFVKKTAADVRQLDQSWQAKLGRTVGEFSGWYDLQRTFGEYDPQTGEKITGGQRAEAGVMTILNFSPGKAIGVFAKSGKMAKTAKIGQEASALGKIKSGRKAVNPAVFKDFFSGAWNSMKGRFRSAKEYLVKGQEAVKRVREGIGNVKVPVGVRVADTGMGARMIVPEKRSLKELGQQFAVKSGSSGTKGTGKNPEIVNFTKEQLSTKPLYSRDPEKWQKKGGKIEISEDGIWTYIDWEIPPNRVSYPGGFPDFKSAGLVRQQVPIGEFKKYDVDFAKADELAPNGPKLDENTWHHHQDLTTMQEINKEMHRRFRHMGGMSLARKLKD
ncbi:pre-toxin TG domain-containing protein [Priestia filamentosa]|nr:pre-toxin TG domain-containing protein [Priestia filamentosa]